MTKSLACRAAALIALLHGFATLGAAQEDSASPTPEQMLRITAARLAIDRMIELERKFDPACADIYLDDAQITIVRRYRDGETRQFKTSGEKIKQATKAAMPAARLRGDVSEYTELESEITKDGVRIKVKRFAKLKNATTRIQWQLMPDEDGHWRIQEERVELSGLPKSGK
ncbi:MAG: hypothetical protein K2Y37_00925 [Pirellulales bacterium]|nr:hypothetical protein [Pirellulales bacterium]